MPATTTTAQDAPTQFVEVDDIRFAYRRFGQGNRPPLVFVNHFRGTLESFDPLISNDLAADREVIVFDNTGVGLSTGRAPDTIEGMTRDAASFIDALELDQVDVCGHSMGGHVTQMLLAQRGERVRRAVLVGTGPRGGNGMQAMRPSTAELFAKVYERQDEMWLPIMFSPTTAAQTAGRAWLQRTRERTEHRDIAVSEETALAHRAAAGAWGIEVEDAFAYLREITNPVLVINGSEDIVIPTINSFHLQQNLPNAQLILHPDSNHGAHFQYPDIFLSHVHLFLDR
jgi:pimeloyl-ACP methyl ester carboxylesterase